MRTRQGITLQSLRAVKGFLTEHADKLPGLAQTGAVKRLDDALALLETHATDQSGSFIDAQSLTQRQRTLRTALIRDHMTPIARVARADLPGTVEFRALRMPRGKVTPEKLGAAANGMAQVAAKYVDTFTAAGLPADFVEKLNTASEAMLSALAERTRTRGRRRGATLGLQDGLSEGRNVVGILDALVQTALQGDTTLLGNWNLIARVPRTPGRPVTIGDSSTSPTPALPSPVTPPAILPPASTPSTAPDSHPSTPEGEQ